MSKLGDKIRKARETTVEVRGKKWHIRRPTEVDMMQLRQGVTPPVLVAFVRGWDGVTIQDILPNEPPHPLEYDPDAAAEWLADDINLFGELLEAVVKSFSEAKKAAEDSVKN